MYKVPSNLLVIQKAKTGREEKTDTPGNRITWPDLQTKANLDKDAAAQ